MDTEYAYRGRYLAEYAKLFPDRVLNSISDKTRVKKGNRDHFSDFLKKRLWQDHKELVAEKHWGKMLRSAQDTRFGKQVVSLEEAKRKEQGRLDNLRRSRNAYEKKYRINPLYRLLFSFRNQLKTKRKSPNIVGFIPVIEYETMLAECRRLRDENVDPQEAASKVRSQWQAIRQRYKKPPKIKVPKIPRIPKISPEVKKRNWLIHEANQQRARDKAAAAAEYKALMSAWKAKWWPILGRASQRKSAQRKRRNRQIRATKAPLDSALSRQIEHIHSGPCICFWCGQKLPKGGEVDHIISLARNGTHTSGNICASCPKCNSAKSDKTPEEVGLLPALL